MKFITEMRIAGSSHALHVDLTEGMVLKIEEGKRLIDKGIYSSLSFDIAAGLHSKGVDAKLAAVSVNVSKDDFGFSVFDDVTQSDEGSPAFSFDDLTLYKAQDLAAVFNVDFFEGFDDIEHVGPEQMEYLSDIFVVDEQTLVGKKIGVISAFMDTTRVVEVLPVESMRLPQQRS